MLTFFVDKVLRSAIGDDYYTDCGPKPEKGKYKATEKAWRFVAQFKLSQGKGAEAGKYKAQTTIVTVKTCFTWWSTVRFNTGRRPVAQSDH